ncbi:MAG TPA: tRNA-dihydrouridine synthase family protein [Anaerolineae bacterium]|nr:tRNA-dihydrouridine synthase family protein [Anaerolineae bacterium]
MAVDSNFPEQYNPKDDASFYVGNVPVYNDVILSPMDGYSDWPFRSICHELGSGMSYTEFVKAEDILKNAKRAWEKLYFQPSERPVVFQLYSDSPKDLVEAAQRVQELEPDIIDINMGCPTRSISGRGAGAGLMRTPLKVARIFRRLTDVLDVPVSAKIRLGWDDDCQPYRLIAKVIEENGGALLAVHGRTKKQGYIGKANWDAIAEIRQVISIPLIGNGDVRTVADIERMKAYTGCDGVMIGRGAITNPWIFSRKDRGDVPPEQVRSLMRVHMERNIAFYGEERGVILFRKNVARYLSLYRLSRGERKRLLSCTKGEEFLKLFDELLQRVINAEKS